MRYSVRVGDELVQLEIKTRPEGGYLVVIGDQRYMVELAAAGVSGLSSLLIDGRSHQLHAALTAGLWDITLDGLQGTAQLMAPGASRNGHESGDTASGRLEVRAPMPGVVKALFVEPQQQIEKGDRLLVLEAMKMNNDIKSPRAGLVQSMPLTVGQRVMKGELLLILE